MLKVGLTGGIGSGKTIVASLFETLDVPVFNSDKRAKTLMDTDVGLINSIADLLGKQVIDLRGKLDRQLIGKLVFGNEHLLERLNALVHPAVFREFDAWAFSWEKKVPYVLKEAAIMFESGSYRQNNFTVMVYAPVEERIRRVMLRDKLSLEEVSARMSRQMNDEEVMKLSDYVIYNDDTRPLIEQVMVLDRVFREERF